MNKKFSTLLTMGLLATSSLCGSAWAQTAPTINGIELEKVAAPANNAAWTGGPYVLVADEDGTLEGSDLLLQAVVSEDGKTVKYYGENLSAFATGAKLKEITWTFTETPVKDVAGVPNGYYYTLTSAASGKPLTVNQSGDLIEKLENCKLDAANHLYTQFSAV